MLTHNKSLLGLQTFGLHASAHRYAEVASEQALLALISEHRGPYLMLGGGSNMLFVDDYAGLLIANRIMGIRISRTFARSVHVTVGAGEHWDHFVDWAVRKGLGGLENLSLIPGTVGAAPIQNIGAYGVEIKDIFVRCTVIELATRKKKTLYLKDCQFGYRDSIFKQAAKGKYCITSVTLRLTTQQHTIRTGYGDIVKQLQAMGRWPEPLISDVREAVIAIRTSKLPDPAKIGNCGSFFKNPEIPTPQYQALLSQFPQMPGYPTQNNQTKVPAGWLIEQCGWKGKRVGNTGCYEKQALVIVNYGGASGQEVLRLVDDIIASVLQRFGIRLEPEVQIIRSNENSTH